MAIESTEFKLKWDKKGRLKVEYIEKEKTEAGDMITSKSPDTHDIVNFEDEQKEMLFKSLEKTVEGFLRGGKLDYYDSE